jgi:hypothetical protein
MYIHLKSQLTTIKHSTLEGVGFLLQISLGPFTSSQKIFQNDGQ